MNYELNIIKVDNGFILETPREEEVDMGPGEMKITHTVVDKAVLEADCSIDDADEYETDDDEKITMAKLLYRVADYFFIHNDRYKKDNLSIKFNKKGSKYCAE